MKRRFLWPYLQGFRILWLLFESYSGILMWILSNFDSSKWFSIVRGTSNSQSSWLWHHLDQWQNSNKIMKHSWIEVGTNGYERIWMWTPVCLVLQNPGWLEHIPRTSTMLLKGNLFPSMLWMKLYWIIFITVCVLGAYQQHQQQAYIPCADCLIRPEWLARPWKLWSVVGFYDLFKTVASFGHVKTVFVFA